jgi:virulence-associated protein VagC
MMNTDSIRRIGIVIGSVALLGLSACAGDSKTEAPQPPAARTEPTEPRLLAEEYAEGEAVIQVINPVDRTVILRDARNRSHTVQVPADVDLARLKPGDTVLIGVYESLSIRILPPGSEPLGAAAAVGSTAPGQPGGRAWGQQLVVVSEVSAIDLANHTVTLRDAEGRLHTVRVKDPEMQQRMSNLRVGDLVEITFSEAVAAKVLPKS